MTFEALASLASSMGHVWNIAKAVLKRLFLERDIYRSTRIKIDLAHGFVRCEVENESMITSPLSGHPSRPSWCKTRPALRSGSSLQVSSRRKRGEDHAKATRSS